MGHQLRRYDLGPTPGGTRRTPLTRGRSCQARVWWHQYYWPARPLPRTDVHGRNLEPSCTSTGCECNRWCFAEGRPGRPGLVPSPGCFHRRCCQCVLLKLLGHIFSQSVNHPWPHSAFHFLYGTSWKRRMKGAFTETPCTCIGIAEGLCHGHRMRVLDISSHFTWSSKQFFHHC